MKKLLLYMLLSLIPLSSARTADSFEKLKNKLAGAKCVRFDFLSIIESDIFERIDTTPGTAYIAADGRYLVILGDDEYLYNLELLYSYSKVNNQVTIEKIDSRTGDEVVFVMQLDSLYDSYAVKKDRQYRLVRKDSVFESNIPDSMLLYMDPEKLVLLKIEYFDINEELNRIVFLEQNIEPACEDDRFIPQYPDSVEQIELW
jgi:outer membrane lipoprotein-sorting protein